MIPFKRIFDAGVKNFIRQIGLNSATTLVMAITIILLTSIFYIDAIGTVIFNNLQQKIGLTAYFYLDASPEEMASLREEVRKMKGVNDVIYFSREDALNKFMEQHSGDATVVQSLEIVGENPLPASLRVKADKMENYEEINNFLQKEDYKHLIQEISYARTEEVLKNAFIAANNTKRISFGIGIFLALIVFIIVSSTVRLAVHSLREEIDVMKTMGASNWLIKGPYMVQGLICGLIASLVSIIFFALVSYFAAPDISVIVGGGFDLFRFYQSGFLKFFSADILAGVLMGVGFNYFAVRQYLKI